MSTWGTDLQAAIVTRLREEATDLSDITIVNASDRRCMDEIDKALAGAGVVAVVLGPDMQFEDRTNVTARCSVRILEKFEQNRSDAGSQVAGNEWAEHVAAWLWNWEAGDAYSSTEVNSVQQLEPSNDVLEWMVELTVLGTVASEIES